MGDGVAVLVAILLLAGNAFFVGAEFALVSARRTQIEPAAAAGSRAARVTLRAMERVSLMMAGAQLGITVCSLGLGAVGEPAVAHLLEGPFAALGVPESLLHPIAFAVALAVVVSLHMVLGEMVPKNIALAGPDRSALVLGPPLYAIVWLLRPLIWLLNQCANVVLRLLKVEPKDEVTSTFTREEVGGLIGESHREGLLDEHEHDLLSGALQFEDTRIADVTIRPSDLVTVAPGVSAAEVESLCAETGFSRFPIRGADGDLTGYLHLKDVLDLPDDQRERAVPSERIREFPTVSTGDRARSVLAAMQGCGAHLAKVTDRGSGALVGVVALEDVIEEIVGEVRDATQQAAEQRG
jgi:CBS domain containing-hemolysin-like protein